MGNKDLLGQSLPPPAIPLKDWGSTLSYREIFLPLQLKNMFYYTEFVADDG